MLLLIVCLIIEWIKIVNMLEKKCCKVNYYLTYIFVHKNHVWGVDFLECVKCNLYLLCWHYSVRIYLEHFNHILIGLLGLSSLTMWSIFSLASWALFSLTTYLHEGFSMLLLHIHSINPSVIILYCEHPIISIALNCANETILNFLCEAMIYITVYRILPHIVVLKSSHVSYASFMSCMASSCSMCCW